MSTVGSRRSARRSRRRLARGPWGLSRMGRSSGGVGTAGGRTRCVFDDASVRIPKIGPSVPKDASDLMIPLPD
eukprot:3385084-Pyramimonas_sp.AAC.1